MINKIKLNTSKILLLRGHDAVEEGEKNTLLNHRYIYNVNLVALFSGIDLMVQQITCLENVRFHGLLEYFIYLYLSTADDKGR